MDTRLEQKRCEPCRGGVPPMGRAEALAMLERIPGWSLNDDASRIRRTFSFGDFMTAQAFAVAVGEIAEAQGHHPDIGYGWGYCTVTYFTHKIGGLHENDFIMAAKVNAIAP